MAKVRRMPAGAVLDFTQGLGVPQLEATVLERLRSGRRVSGERLGWDTHGVSKVQAALDAVQRQVTEINGYVPSFVGGANVAQMGKNFGSWPQPHDPAVDWPDVDRLLASSRFVHDAVQRHIEGDVSLGEEERLLLASAEKKILRFTLQNGRAYGNAIPAEGLGGPWTTPDPAQVDPATMAAFKRILTTLMTRPPDPAISEESVATHVNAVRKRKTTTNPGYPSWVSGAPSQHIGAAALCAFARAKGDQSALLDAHGEWLHRNYPAAPSELSAHGPVATVFSRSGQAKGPQYLVGLRDEGPFVLGRSENMFPRLRMVFAQNAIDNCAMIEGAQALCAVTYSHPEYEHSGNASDPSSMAPANKISYCIRSGDHVFSDDTSQYDMNIMEVFLDAFVECARSTGLFTDWDVELWQRINDGYIMSSPLRLRDAAAIYPRRRGLTSGRLTTKEEGSLINSTLMLLCVWASWLGGPAAPMSAALLAFICEDIAKAWSDPTRVIRWIQSSDDTVVFLRKGAVDPEAYAAMGVALGTVREVVQGATFLRLFYSAATDKTKDADAPDRRVIGPFGYAWSYFQGTYSAERREPFKRVKSEFDAAQSAMAWISRTARISGSSAAGMRRSPIAAALFESIQAAGLPGPTEAQVRDMNEPTRLQAALRVLAARTAELQEVSPLPTRLVDLQALEKIDDNPDAIRIAKELEGLDDLTQALEERGQISLQQSKAITVATRFDYADVEREVRDRNMSLTAILDNIPKRTQ